MRISDWSSDVCSSDLPAKLIDIIAALEQTFGGINLEDIKSPECFIVEGALRNKMKIPVFNDDQHGTAITVAAATITALRVVGKKIAAVSQVSHGDVTAPVSDRRGAGKKWAGH